MWKNHNMSPRDQRRKIPADETMYHSPSTVLLYMNQQQQREEGMKHVSTCRQTKDPDQIRSVDKLQQHSLLNSVSKKILFPYNYTVTAFSSYGFYKHNDQMLLIYIRIIQSPYSSKSTSTWLKRVKVPLYSLYTDSSTKY